MYGIMAAHEGHAYIDMVEGPPREISEVIHHTTGCIGLSRTASEHSASPTTLHAFGGKQAVRVWIVTLRSCA